MPLAIFTLAFFIDSFRQTRNLKIAFLSIIASFTQLMAYGAGFSVAFYSRIVFKKGEFKAFSNSFYQ